MPNFGGRDCDRLWPYRFGGSGCGLAGERGYFRSCSGKYVVIVINPAFPEFDCNGIRSRAVSCTKPSATSAEPNGTAVCDTFSRTSYTVKRINEFLFKPSQERNIIVHKYCGFEHLCKSFKELNVSVVCLFFQLK